MARRYWQLVGEPGRTVLIRREKAYHGMHTAGAITARENRRDAARPRELSKTS